MQGGMVGTRGDDGLSIFGGAFCIGSLSVLAYFPSFTLRVFCVPSDV